MKFDTITSIKRVGVKKTSDLIVKKNHNFVANNILVHNSGHGKTLATEKIVESYHKKGYIIIIMEDVKDAFEFAYAMFEPRAKYHVELLQKYNIKPEAKQVNLYHPFTFNLPRKKHLPEMNIFTLPIKDLSRDEFSMLLEEKKSSASITLLVNNIERLNKQDGLWEFIHKIRSSVKSEGKFIGKRKLMPTRTGFYTDTPELGTKTNLSEIESHLRPFLKDLFLMPDEFDMNLDFRKIYQDQKSYHFFVTKYIRDPKIRYFLILYIFNQLIKHRDESSHPVLFVFEEVRKLVPKNSEGFKFYLAEAMRDKFSIIRNIGKGGCSSIMNSQVLWDIDDKVKASATQTLFGNMGDVQDIRRLCKDLDYGTDIKEYLNTMGLMEFIVKGEEYVSTSPVFKILPPSHMHAEEEYDFYDEYRKVFKDKMRTYEDIYDKLESYKKIESRKWKKISEERKARLIQEYNTREEKKKKEILEQQQLTEVKQMRPSTDSSKDKLLPLILEDRKTMSLRQLEKKYNVPMSTIRRWIRSVPNETAKKNTLSP